MSKRQQILEAAERVFRAKGLAGATTREIARDAGCAEGTLYLHFADRMALFSAVLHECLPDVKEAFYQLEILAGKRTVRLNLEGAARTFMQFQQRAQGLVCSLVAEPELLSAHRARLKAQNTGPQIAELLLSAYLKAEQKLGRVNRRISPEAAASMILGSCFYRVFVPQYMDIPMPEQPDVFVRKMIDGVLRGLKPSAVAGETEGADSLVEIGSLHT